jgi:glycosyltransferase involved in cell wall biosynthesis
MDPGQQGANRMTAKAPTPLRDPGGVSELKVSLIIPALNEAAGLQAILWRIPAEVDELIIVDGNSVDETAAVVRAFREELTSNGTHPEPRVTRSAMHPRDMTLRFETQRGNGKGDAIKHGLRMATGDLVVTMDADGSMNPEEIPAFLDCLVAGCDVVKGSRVLQGGGSHDFTLLRRLGNAALTQVANLLCRTAYTDITYGFTAHWREAITDPSQLPDGWQLEMQVALRGSKVGLVTAEVPCFEERRIGGASKLNPLRDGFAILKTILRESLRQPLGFTRVPNGPHRRAEPRPFDRQLVLRRQIHGRAEYERLPAGTSQALVPEAGSRRG